MHAKSLFVFLALCVCAALADDTSSLCIATNSTTFDATCVNGNGTLFTLDEWNDVTVPAGGAICQPVNSTDSESDDNVFVIALRPGGDAAGPVDQVQANALDAAGNAFGCAAVQEGQEDEDMDFNCYAPNTFNSSAKAYVLLSNRNTTADATLEVYVGFADGSVSTCSSDYVDGGSNTWVWIVAVVVVLLVIVVIILAVVGVVMWKKKQKQSAYDLYEEA